MIKLLIIDNLSWCTIGIQKDSADENELSLRRPEFRMNPTLSEMLSWLNFVIIGYCVSEFIMFKRSNRILKELMYHCYGPEWNGRITEVEHFIVLKEFLNSRISNEGLDTNYKRPLFRNSVLETLALGKGYCGENARVGVRILNLCGIQANRLYLQGPRWGHVVCEFKWNGERFLLDGHACPQTFMPNEMVCFIKTVDFQKLPNKVDDINPWIDYCRIKIFYKRPVFHMFSKLAMPRPFNNLVESPHLLRIAIGVILIFINTLLILSPFSIFHKAL